MRTSFKQLLLVVALAAPTWSCVPVPIGVGVGVPIAPAPPPVVVAGPGFEVNVDRPGSDYRSFDLPAPQPDICRNQCMSETACVAFTYVNPGVQGPAARCWLKNSVPPPNPSGCCVSGVKYAGGPPPPPPPPMGFQALERGMNRPGMDFRSFDLPAPNPEICREACYRDPRCVAFTYVHPGVQGPAARCWLKNPAPEAVPDRCCISGVK
jgi:1-phosphatidylinositol phosphodiesterase